MCVYTRIHSKHPTCLRIGKASRYIRCVSHLLPGRRLQEPPPRLSSCLLLSSANTHWAALWVRGQGKDASPRGAGPGDQQGTPVRLPRRQTGKRVSAMFQKWVFLISVVARLHDNHREPKLVLIGRKEVHRPILQWGWDPPGLLLSTSGGPEALSELDQEGFQVGKEGQRPQSSHRHSPFQCSLWVSPS